MNDDDGRFQRPGSWLSPRTMGMLALIVVALGMVIAWGDSLPAGGRVALIAVLVGALIVVPLILARRNRRAGESVDAHARQAREQWAAAQRWHFEPQARPVDRDLANAVLSRRSHARGALMSLSGTYRGREAVIETWDTIRYYRNSPTATAFPVPREVVRVQTSLSLPALAFSSKGYTSEFTRPRLLSSAPLIVDPAGAPGWLMAPREIGATAGEVLARELHEASADRVLLVAAGHWVVASCDRDASPQTMQRRLELVSAVAQALEVAIQRGVLPPGSR